VKTFLTPYNEASPLYGLEGWPEGSLGSPQRAYPDRRSGFSGSGGL